MQSRLGLMKIVYRTGDYTDFLVCRSKLDQAGLHVHSDNAESYAAMPELGLSDGYRIWVLDEDYDEAHFHLKGDAPIKNKDDSVYEREAPAIKFSNPLKWLAIAAAVVIVFGTYQALIARDHENLKYLGPAHSNCKPNQFC